MSPHNGGTKSDALQLDFILKDERYCSRWIMWTHLCMTEVVIILELVFTIYIALFEIVHRSSFGIYLVNLYKGIYRRCIP